jgi:hypothetical protein
VPVEVPSSSEDRWEVVSIPAEGCSTARRNLETEDEEPEALESVSLTLPDEGEGLNQPTG